MVFIKDNPTWEDIKGEWLKNFNEDLTRKLIFHNFNKEDKNLHIFTIADVFTFLSDNEKNPTNIAKAIVNCFIANVGRFNIDTIAVDEMDIFATLINSEYSEDEYFRELSKCCKENKFNLLYTKGIDKISF